MACPECTATLPPGVAPDRAPLLRLGLNGPRHCAVCGGYWFSNAEFDEFIATSEQQRGDDAVWHAPALSAVRYLRCPDCSQLMARVNFRRSSGIHLQHCPHHGWWCAAEQLEQIARFFRSGRWRKQGPTSRPPRAPSDAGDHDAHSAPPVDPTHRKSFDPSRR